MNIIKCKLSSAFERQGKMGLTAAVIVLLVCASETRAAPSERQSSPQLAVNRWMESQAAGAVSVALVTPNSIQFINAGNLLPKSVAGPTEDTIYEIGSVTKGFTGLLLADQMKIRKVSEEDNLAKLLTDWPGTRRYFSPVGALTLIQLATHSSGLTRLPGNMYGDYLNAHADNPYATYTTRDLYSWLDTVDYLNPGRYDYSNAGFGILGHALALAAGQTYEDLLNERLLIPLGLKDTAITLDDSQKSRIAPGHDVLGKPVQNWDWDVMAPAGSLRSTAMDLAHFLKIVTGIEESDESFKTVLEEATHERQTTHIPNLTVGLGWHRTMIDGKLVLFHDGGTGGYNSYVGWYPEQQKGVAVVSSVAIDFAEVNPRPNAGNLGVELLKQL